MKTPKYLISLGLLFAIYSNLFSQVSVVKNHIFKYKSDANTSLILNNNLGNINIINSKNDSIIIRAKITSTSKNEKKAIKRLAYASINNQLKDNIINISTKLSSDNIKNTETENLNIEYTISAPIYTNLFIANKYGDININEHHGKLNINLKYGNLNAKHLVFTDSRPLPKMNFEYSDISIDYCNWAEITAKYCNINIKESRTLVINSSYSKIDLKKNSLLKINSKNDFIKAEELSKIDAKSEYTNYKIKYILSDINVIGSNGNFKTEYISKDFDSIKLNIKYSNITIKIDKDASYKTNCTVEYGTITKPLKANINIYKNDNFETIEGIIGSDKKTTKRVEINSTYGNVVF